MESADTFEVTTLRRVRKEVETTTVVGRGFIHVVNQLYYSFSPQLAAALGRHEALRLATRDVVVRPIAAAVSAIDHCAAVIPHTGLRHAALIGLLSLLAITGVALIPIATLGIMVHPALRSMRRIERDSSGKHSKGGGTRNAC
jgi:hypothetical protein